MRTPYLSLQEVGRLYDRVGRWQDIQVYERRAVSELISLAQFEDATSVFEFGCGTGAFAARILSDRLPADAHYLGVDVSAVMVRLASERLRPWRDRAEAWRSDGSMEAPARAGRFDRFVANYVLDLLSPADADRLLDAVHSALVPGGLACLTSLSVEGSGISRFVARAWAQVWKRWPRAVGGCRPVQATGHLPHDRWDVTHRRLVTSLGIASEVVVARRL